MIGGAYPAKAGQRDVSYWLGKWAGSASPTNGVYTPKQRPDGTGVLCRGVTLTRTGTGLYTFQFTGVSNVSNSVPNFLDLRGQVHSPGGTVYTVTVLALSGANGNATIQIQTGGADADPIANETIVLEATLSDAGQP